MEGGEEEHEVQRQHKDENETKMNKEEVEKGKQKEWLRKNCNK